MINDIIAWIIIITTLILLFGFTEFFHIILAGILVLFVWQCFKENWKAT